jgi:tRNA threonylcarbamoyladenosine biosynthesis protein TsaE
MYIYENYTTKIILMQILNINLLELKKKYLLNNIWSIKLPFKLPSIIFLIWDLWSWKTTLSKHIIGNILWVKDYIKSPTYTYYNKYTWKYKWKKINIIHFDLYRLKNYDEFFAIGGEDILDNNKWIIIIEWPEIIKKYYKPDLEIIINKTKIEDERELEIIS